MLKIKNYMELWIDKRIKISVDKRIKILQKNIICDSMTIYFKTLEEMNAFLEKYKLSKWNKQKT